MARQDSIEQRVATRIRELREARGLSQAELARLVNRSRSQVAQVERGERAPTVTTLASFAGALGVPISELVSSEPTKTSRNPQPEPVPDSMRRLVTMLRTRPQSYVDLVERFVLLMDRYEEHRGTTKGG